MYKAYKFRMYPNKEQMAKLNSFLGSSRFIYNYYLDKKIKLYENNINYSLKEMKADLVNLQNEYEFLKEVDGTILRTSLENLDDAYNRFYQKQNDFPKYKRKNNHDTYKTKCIRGKYKEKEYANIKINNGYIKLPKIDEIKIRGYRNIKEFDKKIISATVLKEANKYYVSVLVEENKEIIKVVPTKIVGIDLGIKDLVTTSDGIKYDKIKFIEKLEKRLKGLQQGLSRTQKGSNNRKKLIEKIQRQYQKIKNARKYYIHHITKEITDENDIVVTEKLKVKQMLQNRNLSHAIFNSSFSEIIRIINYKCKWKGKIHLQVEEYYPSSKKCNKCGHKYRELTLNERKWKCDECNVEHDRDINASINIMERGIELYYKEQY